MMYKSRYVAYLGYVSAVEKHQIKPYHDRRYNKQYANKEKLLPVKLAVIAIIAKIHTKQIIIISVLPDKYHHQSDKEHYAA